MCAGEAAGIAMGLVMLGTKQSTAIEDMVAVSIKVLRVLKNNPIKYHSTKSTYWPLEHRQSVQR